MNVSNLLWVSTLLLISSSSYAMLCPGNFNQINPGDSLESVQAKCGKPLSQKTSESAPNNPQEWNYYLKISPTDTATVKTSVAFVGGKVVNISVNNVGITNTGVCGPTIQVGDSQQTVEKACGKPAFISQNNGPASQVQQADTASKNTSMTYSNGITTTTLYFENGVLKNSK